jgi:ATP-dependent RNA helicase DeaD
MALNIGKTGGIAPAHIVSAIAQASGLTGGDIGKIEIRDDITLVAVPESELNNVIAAMNRAKIRGRQVSATAYDNKKPELRPRRDYEKRDYGDRRSRDYSEHKDYRRLPPKKRGR